MEAHKKNTNLHWPPTTLFAVIRRTMREEDHGTAAWRGRHSRRVAEIRKEHERLNAE